MPKLRVLSLTSQKKLNSIAQKLNESNDTAVDTIPPAYNVEKVRLLIVCISPKKINTNVIRFFDALDITRAANIAFVTDSDPASLSALCESCKTAGINVIDNIHFVKCGLFSSASENDYKNALEWKSEIEKDI